MITDPHLAELQALFVQHGVVLAYLFGSHAEGRATPRSDVDIAVLLPPSTPRERFFEVRLSLTNALMDVFHKEVDVAVLNEISPLLARDVAEYGRLLYEDPMIRPAVEFVVHAKKHYADTAHFRTMATQYLGEDIERYRQRLPALMVREKAHD